MEEALSGAIKLARYAANSGAKSSDGLLVDEDGRLEHFIGTEMPGFGTIHYIPGVCTHTDPQSAIHWLEERRARPGFVGAFLSTLKALDECVIERMFALNSSQLRPFSMIFVDRRSLTKSGNDLADCLHVLSPDLVVFDESFADHAVPFGAFAATKQLYRHWNRRGMSTFHSTTFQPNTISSLHFMRCLRQHRPGFIDDHAAAIERIEIDLNYRSRIYRDLYSPSLARLISAVGFDQASLRASGHYVETAGKRIFDAVAGVACSIRGHNPPGYLEEIEQTGALDDCRDEMRQRLHATTRLPHVLPAVSGASAVEQALKIALSSQFPRTHVLALRGGFGGKTLLALTGTWKPSLKSGLAPLYPNVVYVDPFAEDAVAALEQACEQFPIAVIQFELVQGVGGVRPLPLRVLSCLNRLREQHGCLLFADEIQTGFYRTGPFVRTLEAGIQPDLMTIGKGASDMMFPIAITMYSDFIQQILDERDCSLPDVIQSHCGSEIGDRTIVNTMRRAEQEGLSDQVRAKGRLFAELLQEYLVATKLVRDVRCLGMLIGIELDVRSTGRRWMKRTFPQCVLMSLLNHPTFPVIAGFCQYEPHVLKLTPPLSTSEDEITIVCETIASVLRLPLHRLAASSAWQGIVRPRLARLRR
jgi:acetylornithine/succinyldiaminopimelate/putrescine aminotransferase